MGVSTLQQTVFPIDPLVLIKNGWKPAVIITVICLVLAGALHVVWPSKYEANAVITVAQVTESKEPINMDTERVVAASDAVLIAATRELGGVQLGDLRDRLAVSVPKGSDVLQFTVTDSIAERAAASANAIAKSYGANRTSSAQTATENAMDSITQRIAELERERNDKTKVVDQRAIDLQLTSLQESLANYSATTYSPSSILRTAVVPDRPTTPGLTLFMAGGFFLGIFASVAFVLTRERYRAIRSIAHVAPQYRAGTSR